MRVELIKWRGKRSQREMAKKYGVSQQAWSFWESGKSTPPAKKMFQLSRASGKSMKSLFPDVFN